jgi:hypothetical protein
MKILATITNIISNYPNGDDMLGKTKSGIIDVPDVNLPPCVQEYLENPKSKFLTFTLLEEE